MVYVYRLDRHVYNQSKGRRIFFWICILRIFWRYIRNDRTRSGAQLNAGLTFGRVALLWVNKKVLPCVSSNSVYALTSKQLGERRAIFLYTVFAIAYVLIQGSCPIINLSHH